MTAAGSGAMSGDLALTRGECKRLAQALHKAGALRDQEGTD